jgi:osmotically inducible protein OsmC
MAIRTSSAIWQGTLKEGSGTMTVGKGVFEGPYTYASRFEEGPGTNPEELIGAAHAGCFSMFLASLSTNAGFTPTSIRTTATVTIENGTITTSELNTEATIPGLDESTFMSLAQDAKAKCPVSKALGGVNIILHARLTG